MNKIKLIGDIGTVFIAIGIVIIISTKFTPYDDTDDEKNKKRSNMRLHIDNRTGCHYLSATFGGITPRLDKKGQHICN